MDKVDETEQGIKSEIPVEKDEWSYEEQKAKQHVQEESSELYEKENKGTIKDVKPLTDSLIKKPKIEVQEDILKTPMNEPIDQKDSEPNLH